MNIFVINLDRRPDRLQHVSDQLKSYEWQRVSAFDGSGASLKQYRSDGWHPDMYWRDPLLKRALTTTEIGCFISHYDCWVKIVESGRPGIIFEDDIELIQGKLHLSQYEDLLRRYDLLYLGYREMSPMTAKSVGEYVVPSYPYLLSSYALTPVGAKKLIDTHIRSCMIPVDEYVPLMIGYDHSTNSSVTNNLLGHVEAYRKYDKLTAIALREPHVKQLSRNVLGSDIESGKRMNEAVIALTVATDPKKAGMLLTSAARHGVAVTNLGEGVEWGGGDMKGPGGGQKINLVKQHLADRVDDSSIVLFMDGYDIILNDDLSTIVERYRDMGADIVFAAEKTCWPKADMADQFPASHTEYRYLNSGVYIGTAAALRKFFADSIENNEDDQLYMQNKFLTQETYGVKAILDVENYIFQCIAMSGTDVVVKSNKQLLNTATRCCPCILHGNGGDADKKRFEDIATALGIVPNQVEFLPAGNSLEVVGPEIVQMDFMSREECAKLIEKAERYGKWESMYGDKFPGQEVRIRVLDINLFDKLEQHFVDQINPAIERHWWPLQMYGLRDAFIIRYSPETQKSLNCHHDASLVSAIVYLNDDYTGGDTYFPRQNFSTEGTEVGKMVLWPGQVTHGHEGREVTSGTKYALVIWTARRPGDVNY